MPDRIVSLVPSLTETLAGWGFADRLVGVTDWCTSPPLPDVARVRGTKNPDVAAIVALDPDLVVADQEENRRIDVERLRAAGLHVHVTAARSLAEAAGCLEALGPVVGAAEPAARLAADMRAALAVPAPVRLRTFCPIWRDPWMAVGNETIAGDLLGYAGFDVVPARPRYPRVDLDDVRAADPDVVLLPDEPYEFGPGDLEAFAGWRAQIRFVDGAQLTWWGPRTVRALTSFRTLATDLVR
ncbi:MAG: helical backbone metal receptor [Ilumatobacteraceae bacterium]